MGPTVFWAYDWFEAPLLSVLLHGNIDIDKGEFWWSASILVQVCKTSIGAGTNAGKSFML
jgi:hypothetical protein